METVFAIEDESFKLCISDDFSKHNFVPIKRKAELIACKNSTAVPTLLKIRWPRCGRRLPRPGLAKPAAALCS